MPAANVSVVCRFRPLSAKELAAGDKLNVELASSSEVRIDGKAFVLDKILPPSTEQAQVYQDVAKPIVEGVVQGYNGTVMAYGQTGSGKTHTMEGVLGDPERQGIVPRMVATLFDHVDQAATRAIEFVMKVSAVEIYMEHVNDMLAPKGTSRSTLKVHEDASRGIWVDAHEHCVACEAEIFALARSANKNRHVAATQMNDRSSRSHYIFTVCVSAADRQASCERRGMLHLVDLAGAEKVAMSGAVGQTLEEAKKINQSLTCLGKVIAALTEGKSRHVPYRDSKLTRLLQHSLGGNSRTALVINCSPGASSISETVSSLRFGVRARCVKNVPKVNENRSAQALQQEVEALRRKCAALERRGPRPPPVNKLAAPQTRNTASQTDNLHAAPRKKASPKSTTFLSSSSSNSPVNKDSPKCTTFWSSSSSSSSERSELWTPPVAAGEKKEQASTPRQSCAQSFGITELFDEAPEPAFNVPQNLILGERREEIPLPVANRGNSTQSSSMRELREEVLALRDIQNRTKVEIDLLQRERADLRRLLSARKSDNFDEERQQWLRTLEHETAVCEAAREELSGFLSNRIRRVVDLEMQIDELNAQIAELQHALFLSPVVRGPVLTERCDSEDSSTFDRLLYGLGLRRSVRTNVMRPVRREPR